MRILRNPSISFRFYDAASHQQMQRGPQKIHGFVGRFPFLKEPVVDSKLNGEELFQQSEADKIEAMLRDLKVYKARRVATMKMMDDGFEEKVKERKKQKLKTMAQKGLLNKRSSKRKRRSSTSRYFDFQIVPFHQKQKAQALGQPNHVLELHFA